MWSAWIVPCAGHTVPPVVVSYHTLFLGKQREILGVEFFDRGPSSARKPEVTWKGIKKAGSTQLHLKLACPTTRQATIATHLSSVHTTTYPATYPSIHLTPLSSPSVHPCIHSFIHLSILSIHPPSHTHSCI